MTKNLPSYPLFSISPIICTADELSILSNNTDEKLCFPGKKGKLTYTIHTDFLRSGATTHFTDFELLSVPYCSPALITKSSEMYTTLATF